MSELLLTDAEATALSGTTDSASGIRMPAAEVDPWLASIYRCLDQIRKVALDGNKLRVYEVDGNANAVGVRSGRVVIAGTAYAYAGADPAVDGLTDNDTTYIWAEIVTAAVAIDSAVDGTGWPTTPHIKLAEVTMVSGAITAIVDRRGEYLLRCALSATGALTENAGAIGGTNDGNLPSLAGTPSTADLVAAIRELATRVNQIEANLS